MRPCPRFPSVSGPGTSGKHGTQEGTVRITRDKSFRCDRRCTLTFSIARRRFFLGEIFLLTPALNLGTLRGRYCLLLTTEDAKLACRHRLSSITYVLLLPCHGRGRGFESRRHWHLESVAYARLVLRGHKMGTSFSIASILVCLPTNFLRGRKAQPPRPAHSISQSGQPECTCRVSLDC